MPRQRRAGRVALKQARHRANAEARQKKSPRSEKPPDKLWEPKTPLPAQHQQKPGIEEKLTPRPRYEAPYYRGAGKLADKVALITGGDSGIGRAVAVLFAREGADIVITHIRLFHQTEE